MDAQSLEMGQTPCRASLNMKRCSVVILNWNGVDMLRRYLPTVVANTSIEGVEIVVADNGSTDDS